MFTVIIPYYKKRKYIERCLDSVLNQTYQNYEIIVIDDGSEDDIKNLILDKYNSSVQFVAQINQGVSVARNRGIAMAKMPFVTFLDADDAFHPQFFEFALQVINENNDVKIIGSHYSSNSNILKNSYSKVEYREIKDYFKIAIKNTLFASGASIVNTDFFKKNPGFNPILKRGQDIEVWFRVLASEGRAFYIANTMMFYSKEDPNQATARTVKVENSFVGAVHEIYKPMLKVNKNSDFTRFISKMVYFKLYPYYFSQESHKKAAESLKANDHYYFFLHLPYYLPQSIGRLIVNNKRFNKLLRLYLKFFLRKVYY